MAGGGVKMPGRGVIVGASGVGVKIPGIGVGRWVGTGGPMGVSVGAGVGTMVGVAVCFDGRVSRLLHCVRGRRFEGVGGYDFYSGRRGRLRQRRVCWHRDRSVGVDGDRRWLDGGGCRVGDRLGWRCRWGGRWHDDHGHLRGRRAGRDHNDGHSGSGHDAILRSGQHRVQPSKHQ